MEGLYNLGTLYHQAIVNKRQQYMDIASATHNDAVTQSIGVL